MILAIETFSRLLLLSEWADDGHTVVQTQRRRPVFWTSLPKDWTCYPSNKINAVKMTSAPSHAIVYFLKWCAYIIIYYIAHGSSSLCFSPEQQGSHKVNVQHLPIVWILTCFLWKLGWSLLRMKHCHIRNNIWASEAYERWHILVDYLCEWYSCCNCWIL